MKQGFPTPTPLWPHFPGDNTPFYGQYLGFDKFWNIEKIEFPTPIPLSVRFEPITEPLMGTASHLARFRVDFLPLEKTGLI